VDNTT